MLWWKFCNRMVPRQAIQKTTAAKPPPTRGLTSRTASTTTASAETISGILEMHFQELNYSYGLIISN